MPSQCLVIERLRSADPKISGNLLVSVEFFAAGLG